MDTLTKHQRRLVLLVVLVLVLVSAPAIIMTMSSSRSVPVRAPSSTTEVIPAIAGSQPSATVQQDKQEQDNLALETQQQAEASLLSEQPDNQTEVAVTTEVLEPEADVEHARGFVAGNWVVVDCERRIVLQCPHKLIAPKPSPNPNLSNSEKLWQGHCRDVSINFGSFCRN